MAKRQRESETSQETTRAADPEVECVIQSLSPMKKSKKGNDYYTGMGSDGKKSIRFIGFDSHTNEQLMSYQRKGESVAIKNCTVKTGPTDEIELFINRTTKIEYSPKKIAVKPIVIPDKTILEVLALEDGVIVNLKAKVLSAEPPRVVSKGLVQDIIVTDGCSTIGITAWEENTNKLEEFKSYKFENLYTRSYQGVKTLTLSRNSSYSIINDEIQAQDPTHGDMEHMVDARIVGVQNFCIYLPCLNCNSNLPLSTHFNTAVRSLRCTSCSVLQSIDEREYEVSTNIIASNGTTKKNLRMCTELILKVLDIKDGKLHDDMEESLLKTPTLDISYTERNNYVKDIVFKP